MSKVICNASPIIGLIGINKFELLWELFDDVLISEAVYDELLAGNRQNETALINDAIAKNHIKIVSIRSKDVADLLYGKLHLGEIETIIGAKEDPSIDFAIIDEKAARAFAATMLVDTLGILGILVHAKEKGLLDAIRPLMGKLIDNNYRISDALYNQVLKRAGEI